MKANTRKRISVIVAIVAVVAICVVAVRVSPIGAVIGRTNEWSAIMSLQQQIEAELQTYHAQHGRYPDSLRTLTIDYSKTDQATPAQLDEFLYRVTDTGYELNSKRDAQKKPATGPILNSNESPNHALQRTGSAVTAPAADHRHLSTHRQVPRPLRQSLSLGSFGDFARVSMNEALRPLAVCLLGTGALFFASCQKREGAPVQSPTTQSKLFLEQQKSVGPKLEWHREVIAVRPLTFRFVVAATKPVSVSLVSDSVLQPLLASNAQLEDGQAIHTQDSNTGKTETTITVQPGKYWILIANRSDETANIDLKCYY